MVVAVIALMVAMGGAGYAASLPRNSVGTSQLKNKAVTAKKIRGGAVTRRKIGTGAVTGREVRDGSLGGADISESSLDTVPNAARLEGSTLGEVRSGIDAATLGGVGPGGFLQGSGRGAGGTAKLSTTGGFVRVTLAELPGLPRVAGVWSASVTSCHITIDLSGELRYFDAIRSQNGALAASHQEAGFVVASSADADGEKSMSVWQVTTQSAAPQVFTVIASVHWDGADCITSAQAFGA